MINNVVLQGKLGQDFDLRYIQSGKAVATTSIAVKKNFPDSQGNYGVDWINIVFWGKQAETVANHFRKGNEILIVGAIQTRNYENQQGEKKYITEINCQSFSFPGGNSQNVAQSEQNQNTGVSNQFEGNSSPNQNNTFKSQDNSQGSQDQLFNPSKPPLNDDPFGGASSTIDISDDDLPF